MPRLYSFIAVATTLGLVLRFIASPISGQELTLADQYVAQLLSDMKSDQLSQPEAAAICASLAIAGQVDPSQRILLRIDSASQPRPDVTTSDRENLFPAPSKFPVAFPVAVQSVSLPSKWKSVIDSARSKPDGSPTSGSAASISLSTAIQRCTDPALVAKRTNRNASLMQSEHFLIEADTPQETLEPIALQCELTYAALEWLFDLRPRSMPLLHIRVMKSRSVYLRLLAKESRQIELTNGFFDTDANIVSCYWTDDDSTRASLRHEVTHQVLTNAFAGPAGIAWRDQTDFWAFEAIATYMESLTLRSGVDEVICSIGGWDAPRVQAARYRRLHDQIWLDWDRLRNSSRESYQAPEDIQIRYSQSAGLAHYFLDYSPEIRTRFTKYIISVHRGTPDASMLEIASDATLRAQYDRYLQCDTRTLIAYSLQPPQRDLVLCRTSVQSSVLKSWPASHRKFEWLDLSFNPLDGNWLAERPSDWQASRLNLESTLISNDELPNIGKIKMLTELDLSNCEISDAGLANLIGADGLEKLWLTGCNISDASLMTISRRWKLRYLNIDKTSVTPDAWRIFLRQNPSIR